MIDKILKLFGQVRHYENVEYVLKDKDGNIKPLFQPNKIFAWLIKKGFVSPFAHQKYSKYQFLMGSWQTSLNLRNLITNAGLAGVASRINGAGSEAAFTYIALGTGTTAANANDIALETEITTGGGERANATASRVTDTVTNDTAQLQHTFTFTSSFAITESGVLNAAAAGVLLCRQVFSAVNVVSGDQLQVTWKITSS